MTGTRVRPSSSMAAPRSFECSRREGWSSSRCGLLPRFEGFGGAGNPMRIPVEPQCYGAVHSMVTG